MDGTGQALSDVSVTDTVRRTGEVLDFSDAFLSAIVRAGDDVIVVASAAGRSGSAGYRFGSDGD